MGYAIKNFIIIQNKLELECQPFDYVMAIGGGAGGGSGGGAPDLSQLQCIPRHLDS